MVEITLKNWIYAAFMVFAKEIKNNKALRENDELISIVAQKKTESIMKKINTK